MNIAQHGDNALPVLAHAIVAALTAHRGKSGRTNRAKTQ